MNPKQVFAKDYIDNIPQHLKYAYDENELLAKLRGFYIESKKAREESEQGWKQFRHLYEDKQNELSNIEGINDIEIIRNYVTSNVRQLLSALMDNSPEIHVLHREQRLATAAQELTRLFAKIWYDSQLNILMPAILCDVLVEGTGIAKTFFDITIDDINVKEVSALDFYPDPYGGLFLRDHRYVIEKCYYDEEEIYEIYPQYAEHLKPISVDDTNNSDTTKNETDLFQNQSAGPLKKCAGRKRYAIFEFWFRDPFAIEGLRLYPDGRRIVTDENMEYILADTENPFEREAGGHGMFPYIIFRDYVHTKNFWGTGDVKDIKKLQELSDKLLNQIIRNAEFTTNNALVVGEGALSYPVTQLKLEPGDVITAKPGRQNEINWLEHANLPSDVFNLVLDTERFIESETGAVRAARGESPTNEAQSGRAILALQQTSDRRIRYKVQHLETAWQRMGEQWLGLIQQFYPLGKLVPISDPMGQIQMMQVLQEHIQGEFDVQVQPDSSLPIDKQSIFQRLVEVAGILSQLGYPTPPAMMGEILKYSDVPNWQQLAQEITQFGLMASNDATQDKAEPK